MKSISEKTGVPEEHLKKLVDAGFMSCTFAGYDRIYYEYKEQRAKCKSDHEARQNVAAKFNVSATTVYYIIKKLS